MSLIKIENLSKVYGKDDSKVVALDNINIDIDKGDFIAIMGASGSGKSTLLNIIGCMDKQSEGQYLLDGEDVSKLSNYKLSKIRNEKLSFVFQNFALLNDYTVYDNVQLPLSFRKISRAKKREVIEEALQSLGIKEKINKKPTELSGGQKQRVAIARALCSDADIILADEPTGALDKNSGVQLMNILKDINKNGKTVIVITHDKNIADYCEKIITLEDGKIMQLIKGECQ